MLIIVIKQNKKIKKIFYQISLKIRKKKRLFLMKNSKESIDIIMNNINSFYNIGTINIKIKKYLFLIPKSNKLPIPVPNLGLTSIKP